MSCVTSSQDNQYQNKGRIASATRRQGTNSKLAIVLRRMKNCFKDCGDQLFAFSFSFNWENIQYSKFSAYTRTNISGHHLMLNVVSTGKRNKTSFTGLFSELFFCFHLVLQDASSGGLRWADNSLLPIPPGLLVLTLSSWRVPCFPGRSVELPLVPHSPAIPLPDSTMPSFPSKYFPSVLPVPNFTNEEPQAVTTLQSPRDAAINALNGNRKWPELMSKAQPRHTGLPHSVWSCGPSLLSFSRSP